MIFLSSEYCVENVIFADLKVRLKDEKTASNLQVKPSGCHQYFHFLSANPSHIKRSIAFSQILHICRFSPNENDFERNKGHDS